MPTTASSGPGTSWPAGREGSPGGTATRSSCRASGRRSRALAAPPSWRCSAGDDDNDQAATGDAFEVLHYIAAKRLAAGRLTVIDATSVQPGARRPLIELARSQHVPAVAIVLDLPRATCAERNAARPERAFSPHVLRQQAEQLRRGLHGLRREGFHRVYVLGSAAEVE